MQQLNKISDDYPIYQAQRAQAPQFIFDKRTAPRESDQDEVLASSTSRGKQSADGKVQGPAIISEYAAWFREGSKTPNEAIQISVLLDTDSERTTISKRSAFAEKIWSADKEADVKSLPFLGREGKLFEAKIKIRLTWHPEGSKKEMDTDFYIIDDDEPVAVLGKEWADFQGIFHDMDFSVSPFRLPGIRSTRGE